MHEALEVCGEFLSHIGALEEANAIAEIMHKNGVELADTSPFRWRALLAAINQELDATSMDIVFLFERLLQLDAMMPLSTSRALFESPLFLHLLVERFEVAFEGLDAELFKLESDELCQAEGIYETCVLLRDKIKENENRSELTTFLETFKKIFEMDEPKDCWDVFYEFYRLNDSAFRHNMKRALCMIEFDTLGPTKLELAFPTKEADNLEMGVPRALLEKKFGGTRREWRDRSRIITIAGADYKHVADDEQEQEKQLQHQEKEQDEEQEREQQQEQKQEQDQDQEMEIEIEMEMEQQHEQEMELEQEAQALPSTVKIEPTESVHSDIPEEAPTPERLVSSRPPRAAEVARRSRQEGRRAAPRTRVPSEDGEPRSISRPSGRRKRVRWSAEEEAALIEGYRRYESYSNVWVLIKTKCPDVLRNRSNVDLKDKYRNLVRYGRLPDSHDNVGVTDNDATDDNAGVADKNDTSDA